MCGINGIIGNSDQQASGEAVRRMCQAMAHRGPDAEGIFVDDEVALGHRRLSIIDLSTAANQPFSDPSGRYVLVFNGEIYNFREIRDELKGTGFLTSSDTEVVLHAYLRWGPDCLSRFRGMFAFAVWDRSEKTLFFARDRFGVKPLYYHVEGSRVLFASEIRSLLNSGLIPRKLSRQALLDYLQHQSAITPLTLVEGILQFPAGHYGFIRNGKLTLHEYWDPSRVQIGEGSQDPAEVRKNIRDLLFRSVERRLVSDVPVGAFLSGGIDSSAVVAMMASVSSTKPMAFTVGFDEKKYDESAYAELVARKYNVAHEKVLLRPDHFLEELPDALRAMDTPSGDGINTYIVSKAIRKTGIKVALSGIGGDELFVGYPIFGQFKKLHGLNGIFTRTALIRKGLAALLPGNNQRMERIKALLKSPSTDISHVYPLLRQIQTDSQIGRLLNVSPEDRPEGTLEALLRSRQKELGKYGDYSQMSMADYLGYTQHVLLKDADQMSMAVSLEIREPFFDHDLVEYVLGLPDDMKGTRYPKQLMVESLAPLIPDEVVHRKKQGFVLPYDVWMRNELSSFCHEKITALSSRVHFRKEPLLAYWDDFLRGNARIRWTDIWIFVVLENWLSEHGVE